MRYLFYILLPAMLCLSAACRQYHDELFTTAALTIDGGDTIRITSLEASGQFSNLNTGEVVTSTNTSSAIIRVRLLQGVYKVYVQGTARYVNQSGTERVRRFRAYSDYIQFTGGKESTAKLQLFFVQ